MKTPRPIYLVALSLAALVALPGARSMAQSAPESTQASVNRANADALDREAANLRQAADAELRRAQEFQKLADDAAKHARDTDNPVAKEVWTETAGDRQKDADRLKKDAEQLRIQAAAKAAEAQRLRASQKAQPAPPGPTARPPGPPPGQPAVAGGQGKASRDASAATQPVKHAPVEAADFIGVWRDTENGRALVIELRYPREPEKANILEAKSQGRHDDRPHDWVGIFLPAAADRPARLTLTTTPKFDEMNTEIPEGARKQVENDLKWQIELELDQTFPFDPQLKAKWYPGEVTWTDAAGGGTGSGGSAKMTGRGKPVEFTYAADGEVDMDMVHAPVIDFDFPGRKPFGRADVYYMAKRDQFRMTVTLPQDVAKAQGEKLQVTFRGLTGGSSTSIELETTAPQLRDITARYTHPDLITIANYGDVPNREPLFGLFIGTKGLGPRVPLSVKNGEVVEISAAGASRRIRVFDRPVELALARQLDGIHDLAIIFNSALNSKVPNAVKEIATKRLRMTTTALRIATDESLAVEVRLAAINEYLSGDGQYGLLLQENLHWIEAKGPQADPDALKPNQFGTIWSAYEEAIQVVGPKTARQTTFSHNVLWDPDRPAIPRAMRIYRQKVEDALAGLVSATTFALYNLVVDFTQGEAVVGWFFGLDRYGNEISVGRRVLAALELTTSALSGALALDIKQTSDVIGPTRRTLPRTGVDAHIPLPTKAPGAGLPPALRQAIPPQQPKTPLGPRPASKPGASGGKYMRPPDPSPIECKYPPASGARSFGRDPTGTRYPQSGEKLLDLDFSRNAQTDPLGCTAAAIADGFEEDRVIVDQLNIRQAIAENRGPPRSLEAPFRLNEGIGYEDISPIMTQKGIPHQVLTYDPNIFRSIKQFRDRGLKVIAHLRYPAGNHHSVNLRELVKDTSGRVTHVKVFDPGPGDIRQLTAQEFADYMYAAALADGFQGSAAALVFKSR